VIRYVVGDATWPEAPHGHAFLVHVCNTAGEWGAGFVLAVSRRWPAPERMYRALRERPLGLVQFVNVEPFLTVVNMIAQEGFGEDGQPPIRYRALATCLKTVGAEALDIGASVVMPRIGCGLAGGTWDRVEPIIAKALRDVDVVVYDLPLKAGPDLTEESGGST
jgi:O-acetyl-ADP-ribose deacetylase (regulator of RNase III)